MTSGLYQLDRHGDQDVAAGVIDFAVNVRGPAPDFVVDAVAGTLGDLARYPSVADTERVRERIGALHGRDPDDVLLLAGASDGFALLPRLAPRHAVLIQPTFTEPELVLSAAGVPITQMVLTEPWTADLETLARQVPDNADLVVLGNPTNPTSVLHPRAVIEALRRPGRIVVVDEAFADLTLDQKTGDREPESVAGIAAADLIVIRSVTKTFGLAGLRAGYLLGAPGVLARLSAGRRAWPVSTPAMAALEVCTGDEGVRYCERQALAVAAERDVMMGRLRDNGIRVCGSPSAPFVTVTMADGLAVKEHLVGHGIAVRSCANFVGMSEDHLRLAIRPAAQVDALLAALGPLWEERGHGR